MLKTPVFGVQTSLIFGVQKDSVLSRRATMLHPVLDVYKSPVFGVQKNSVLSRRVTVKHPRVAADPKVRQMKTWGGGVWGGWRRG